MPPINRKWALYLLRRDMKDMAKDTLQPIILHRYVLIDQNDLGMGPPSWSWAGSWETRIDTMGRETWFVETTPASTQSKRNFVCILPYDPSSQTFDPSLITTADKLLFIDVGTNQEYGEFKINLVRVAKTHVELHIEMIQ